MTALFIILTGVLVLVNAFFVIAEYSLVRSRKSRLQEMADKGKRGARLALAELEDIGDYIAACQVGITMASIAGDTMTNTENQNPARFAIRRAFTSIWSSAAGRAGRGRVRARS